jgi:hypothetical protein
MRKYTKYASSNMQHMANNESDEITEGQLTREKPDPNRHISEGVCSVIMVLLRSGNFTTYSPAVLDILMLAYIELEPTRKMRPWLRSLAYLPYHSCLSRVRVKQFLFIIGSFTSGSSLYLCDQIHSEIEAAFHSI